MRSAYSVPVLVVFNMLCTANTHDEMIRKRRSALGQYGDSAIRCFHAMAPTAIVTTAVPTNVAIQPCDGEPIDARDDWRLEHVAEAEEAGDGDQPHEQPAIAGMDRRLAIERPGGHHEQPSGHDAPLQLPYAAKEDRRGDARERSAQGAAQRHEQVEERQVACARSQQYQLAMAEHAHREHQGAVDRDLSGYARNLDDGGGDGEARDSRRQ